MNVMIQSVKFDADKKLLDFVQTKVGKLERYSEQITSADVTMKLDKDEERGNKVVAIRLEVPGEDLVAEFRSKSFEESVDECITALRRQIERYKDKWK